MEIGDTQTITIKQHTAGSYLKSLEKDWLEFLGFTKGEIDSGEITLIVKAEIRDKKIPFVSFAKK